MIKAAVSRTRKTKKIAKPIESSNDDDFVDDITDEESRPVVDLNQEDGVSRRMAARRRLEVLREERELQAMLSDEFGW